MSHPISKVRSHPISKLTSHIASWGASQISRAISFIGSCFFFSSHASIFSASDWKRVPNQSSFFHAIGSDVPSSHELPEDHHWVSWVVADDTTGVVTISCEWSIPSFIVTAVFWSRKRLSKSHIEKGIWKYVSIVTESLFICKKNESFYTTYQSSIYFLSCRLCIILFHSL